MAKCGFKMVITAKMATGTFYDAEYNCEGHSDFAQHLTMENVEVQTETERGERESYRVRRMTLIHVCDGVRHHPERKGKDRDGKE